MSGTVINYAIFKSTKLYQHQACFAGHQNKTKRNSHEKLTAAVMKNWQCVVSGRQSSIWRNKKCNARANCFNSEHKSRRRRATTRQQDRFVVLTSLRDRAANTLALRTQLRTVSNVSVSDQMTGHRLRQANLRSWRPAVGPCLTQANCAACLAWARRIIWHGQSSSGPRCSF